MTTLSVAPERTGTDTRASYIEGLRALADVLEKHDEVPLPFDGHGNEITLHFLGGDNPRAAMAAAARAFPIQWTKKPVEHSDGTAYFYLKGTLHGVKLELVAFRDAVCERVVTGTEDREVEEVIEPAKTRTVVKPVEVVEWVCHSILAPAAPERAEGDAAA